MVSSTKIDSNGSGSVYPEGDVFSLTYVSSAVRPFSKAELDRLLVRCRENNTGLGITGMLLYKDGNFMQVLEGETGAVHALYEKINTDPRHSGEIILQQGSIEERRFPDWSMGFRDLASPEVHAIPGYSQFLNTPLTGREFSAEPARSQRLLLTFKKNM